VIPTHWAELIAQLVHSRALKLRDLEVVYHLAMHGNWRNIERVGL